jgi:hypothetical protein
LYKPKHFELFELIPPELYYKLKKECRLRIAWYMLDDRMLRTADSLRNMFGSMVANDWWWGGKHQERGLRVFDTTTGAEHSQHKFGRALDSKFTKVAVEEVREFILQRPRLFPFITCIEKDVSWLHYDVRNHYKQDGEILVV